MQEALKPKYGLVTAITMVVGSVVGVGIFLRAPRMSLSAGGDTTAVIIAWIVAALMIIPIALIIAEIGSMAKKTGGMQIYGEETWGNRYGFTIGWAQSFFYFPANLAFMLYLTAEYTSSVFNLNLTLTGIVYLCLFYAVSLYLMNVLFEKLGGYIQIVATFVKVIPLIAIGVVGSFYFGDRIDTLGTDPALLSTLEMNSGLPLYLKVFAVIPAALFAFEGWIFVGIITKEIKNSARNVPLAIIGGLIGITCLYLLFTYASFNVADSKALATRGADNISIATTLFGNTFANMLNAFVLISALGVANANTLVLIRSPYALAQSRTFLGSAWLSKVNKHNISANAGLLGLALVSVYLLVPFILGKATDGNIYGLFIDSAILLFFGMYAVVCIGVVRLRITQPNAERPFKTPFIWMFLVLAIIGALMGMYGLYTAYASNLMPVIIFVLCALSGSVIYGWTKEVK